jgi:hypothetical protein
MSIIDDRPLIALAVERAMKVSYPQSVVTRYETTSGCPVIRVSFGPDEAFNITITRTRARR